MGRQMRKWQEASVRRGNQIYRSYCWSKGNRDEAKVTGWCMDDMHDRMSLQQMGLRSECGEQKEM